MKDWQNEPEIPHSAYRRVTLMAFGLLAVIVVLMQLARWIGGQI